MEHILNSFKVEVSFPKVLEFAKLAIIVPVTNAWPERGASAVKRIKSRQRSTMKNDLLNALLHISMNGPPVNSPEAEHLISRVVEQYCEQKHNKVPQIYVTSKINRTICTQKVDIDEDNESIEIIIEKMEERDDEFIATNLIMILATRTVAATRMTIVMTKYKDVSPCCRKFYLYPFCSLLFVV